MLREAGPDRAEASVGPSDLAALCLRCVDRRDPTGPGAQVEEGGDISRRVRRDNLPTDDEVVARATATDSVGGAEGIAAPARAARISCCTRRRTESES